jgi:hypothetical protein
MQYDIHAGIGASSSKVRLPGTFIGSMCWPVVKSKPVVTVFLVWIVKLFFWGLSLLSGYYRHG